MPEPISKFRQDQLRRIENSAVDPVVARLRSISDAVVIAGLTTKAEIDPRAGIVIKNLTDIEPVTTGKGEYHFHSALVRTSSPEAPNFVNPHFHEIGQEPYRIVQGSDGEMNLGWIVEGAVVWDAPFAVGAGDEINVDEGQVHSLRNNGEAPLIFTFACPDAHLIDKTPDNPDGDRVFTRGFPNGIPPQYPK